MAISRTFGFEASEGELTFYNGQAVLNLPLFYYNNDESNYDFPGYSSSFLYVYDSPERETVVKSFTTQVTRNSNAQVLNMSVSDMTFEANGTYYFEVGYVRSGYEVVLRFGDLEIV